MIVLVPFITLFLMIILFIWDTFKNHSIKPIIIDYALSSLTILSIIGIIYLLLIC